MPERPPAVGLFADKEIRLAVSLTPAMKFFPSFGRPFTAAFFVGLFPVLRLTNQRLD